MQTPVDFLFFCLAFRGSRRRWRSARGNDPRRRGHAGYDDHCAAGGLLIRELKLLEKYLPHDGKYKDATYDVEWKNFTSGAPITNEMVAGKLDFGAMADFPGSLNGVAFKKAGKRSLFIGVLSGSVKGSGNGIVVPSASSVQSLAELKGKTISVPFASTAHGMLLRAVTTLGWDPDKDVKIIAQAPEVAGSALQSNQIDAHADFVPFAELFPSRGFARKIFDGSQAGFPTFHGLLVDGDYADKYPEVVVAYLRATIEANTLLSAEPEKYSELIAKVTGIDAPVNYLFHGPLGLQTRDLTWKPEYRKDVATSVETLKLLKRTDIGLDLDTFITDKYIRAAFKASGLDYDARLGNTAPVKVMNIIDTSAEGNMRIARGIHATAGIGRNISSGGRNTSSASFIRAIASPRTMAVAAAIAKPAKTRIRLLKRCGASLPERTKATKASSASVGAGTLANVTKPR